MTAALPPDSFVMIAADLFVIGRREAIGNEGLAAFVAAHPTPGMVDNLCQCQRAAAIVGTLHDLFRTLAPHEAEFRALVEAFLAERSREAA